MYLGYAHYTRSHVLPRSLGLHLIRPWLLTKKKKFWRP